MIKRIKRQIKRQFRLVKKYKNKIEAELAQEILEAYHINAFIFKNYFGRMNGLFVRPNDYWQAVHLLNISR